MEKFVSELDLKQSDYLAQNLADLVRIGCARNKNRTAFSIVLPTGHTANLSYDRLDYLSDCVAAYVREDIGLGPNDVIAIQSLNILSYPVIAFGIFKSGVIVTNINPLYTIEETRHQLQDSGAKALFVIDVFADKVAEAIKGTQIKRINSLSLVDLFPFMKAKILAFGLKKIKKLVPDFQVDVTDNFSAVIQKGELILKKGIDPGRYSRSINPDDLAIYQYTGGTTGRSKGAKLSHKNIVANISQGEKINVGAIDQGVNTMMLLLPLYHVYALAVGALASLYNGTNVVLVPVPRPLKNLKSVFEKFDITILPGLNTLFVGLMKEEWFVRRVPANIRFSLSGGAPLQPSVSKAWEKLTGSRVYEGYGLTESTCVCTISPLGQEPRAGFCGKILPGTEIKLVDDQGCPVAVGQSGELWVKGPQVMQGYLNNEAATQETLSEDGWLKTGDIASIDNEGWVRIVDRLKDMIIVSGFNVFPAEIEDILTRHDWVSEAAVVGFPCSLKGEKIIAYIVSVNEELKPDILSDHCRKYLTGYKIPSEFIFLKELPKTPVGKVLRRTLRDQTSSRLKGKK